MSKINAQTIHELAHAAGHKAAMNSVPTPMHVYGQGTNEIVNDGVCGFASVHFKGNTSFGRQMLKLDLASKSCMGGLYIWVSDYRQSMTRKQAYASAYAAVVREHGVDAWTESRMD